MSLSTLPPESAAAIADWLRNQPVVSRRREEPSGKPASQASRGPVAEAAVIESPRAIQGVIAAQPRRTSLLLKSLQTLQSPNEQRRKAAASAAASQVLPQRQSKPNLSSKSIATREAEQIDPLPDFDLGSLFDQDHCVFVGNRARAELADWLPVVTSTANNDSSSEKREEKPSCSKEQVLAQASDASRSNPSKSLSGQGGDRRAYPRRDSDGVVTVCRRSIANRLFPKAPNLPWKLHSSALKGRLIDVSMTGMALSLAEPLPEGTPVSLQVTSRSLDQPAEVTGHVLRCLPIEAAATDGENHWRLVCQLDNRLTFEQVHSLGKQMFAYTMV